ncbi:type 1 glutamine amidotransferase domain-containing protein [Bifidobacterium sp. ESL0790]|uniref:type 1 glutamine amidotransferase domain-containing protein n=1 Tax=Bifidobacterium sp. ESL0790 TaxID=2983233 RepID=UPI0023F96D1B|nr:type 1 glutamine amidotransferase domain-containing protein [Bifidobacterium sp. ESL0790]WEV72572.1 type 1 glutamine amidotransferase [Bifidobacterium sp. ESL0790]
MASLEGKKVLIIVRNWGIEETEMTRPLRDLRADGADVTLAAAEPGIIETVRHDRYVGEIVDADTVYSAVKADDFDMLVVPGGTCNVDRLRVDPAAQALAKDFAAAGKPIASICHGAWLLVNAGMLKGKTLTACRYIAADIENAGGKYVDEQVHVDDAEGFRLITSRKPADLDAFVAEIEKTLAE